MLGVGDCNGIGGGNACDLIQSFERKMDQLWQKGERGIDVSVRTRTYVMLRS